MSGKVKEFDNDWRVATLSFAILIVPLMCVSGAIEGAANCIS